jgi:carnosine N-methyltransferase
MAQIYALLKPGGCWINLGPLLWPGGGQCKLELSLEEVLAAAEELGFAFTKSHPGGQSNHLEAQRTVECEYTGDPQAMMRWAYKAEFWVAKKPAS